MSSVEQTTTDVMNLALVMAGVSKPIANIQTETSLEAQACRTFYDIARQDVLREIPWYFATKQITPALVANYPTPEWNYAYQYPQDAIRIHRFISWRLNNETRQSRVPYAIMQPSPVALSREVPQPTSYATGGLWIFTNWPGPNITIPVVLEYCYDHTNVSQWSPDYTLALAYKLAIYNIPIVMSGDPYGASAKVEASYTNAITKAKASMLNEEQRPEEPQSEFIRGRTGIQGYGVPGSNWTADPSGFTIY